MNQVVSILFLIILAIVTHYVVSWAGSIQHSIGNVEVSYAMFTFSVDRYMPMTTNILMNVLIPNVIMIFVFMFSQTFEHVYVEQYLLIYVIAFFVWRMLMICVFLRRKEMYSWIYEISMAVAGIAIAYLLIHFFFATEQTVFIAASELREELWFAIIVVLYNFVKQILDKKVIQYNVLKEGQITKYIIRQFNLFYKKYNHILDVNKDNKNKCIFLYAVMIFEDYNRGPIFRKIEKIKFFIKKKATLGIMQVETDHIISDEESIIKFWEWLECETGEEDLEFDENSKIFQLAWLYNNDDRYANSVCYIYNSLYKYIDSVPYYRKNFFMRDISKEDVFRNDIRKLKIMYEEGLLSSEEYEQKKEELIYGKTDL